MHADYQANAAQAALQRQHGIPTTTWTYHDAKGEPVGYALRWDGITGKRFLPVSKHGTEWRCAGMPTPRPLYGLPDLDGVGRVYVVEGEKCADAMRSLGFSATTSSHGSKSARQTDWAPLVGREVVILPDNDEPGRAYAESVAALLSKLDPSPTVRLVDLSGLGDGEDIVDYCENHADLDANAIRREIKALVGEASVWKAPEAPPDGKGKVAPAGAAASPRVEILTYRPFPTHVLPEPVRSFVAEASRAIGCDAAYVALPMLSALAAAIGNTRRLQLKRGWLEPPILWTAIVGESGSMKTPAFRLAMQPIRARQTEAFRHYDEALARFEAETMTYEKDVAAWKRSKAGGGVPPEKPQPPEPVRYIVSDTTIEALMPILRANSRGVLVARDELSGLFGAFDKYSSGKGSADVAHWLSMFGAESLTIDRKIGRAIIHIPSAAVSITGSIQPGILRRVLRQELREAGFLARLLFASPPRRKKRWSEATIPQRTEAAVVALFDGLYDLEPGVRDDGSAKPMVVGLTPAAKRAWITFVEEHAEEALELTGDLASAWSKLECYAARLALIVHLIRAATDPAVNADAVDEQSIEAGVTLSRWFSREVRRVYASFGESEEDRWARELLEWIEARGGSVSVRDLTHGVRRFRDQADAARAAISLLVDAGYGEWVQPPVNPRGGCPSARFELKARDGVTNTTTDDPVSRGFGDGDLVTPLRLTISIRPS